MPVVEPVHRTARQQGHRSSHHELPERHRVPRQHHSVPRSETFRLVRPEGFLHLVLFVR